MAQRGAIEESMMSEDGVDAYRMSERAPMTVEDIMKLDAEDESLRRYKEQLLGSAAKGDLGDTTDKRRVVVDEFRVVFENAQHNDIVYKLNTPDDVEYMRSTPFSMEEGCRYKFSITFRVNQSIVSGLCFRNKVKKSLLSNSDKVVLGSYAPRSLPYEFLYPRHEWMQAPSGMFYRGKYMAQFCFVDDDKLEHLKVLYTFEIKKA